MAKMLNLETIKVEGVDDYNLVPICINIPDIFEMSYKDYSNKLEEIIGKALEKVEENTLFLIHFHSGNMEYEDCEYFYKVCGGILLRLLTENEHRNREHRLTAPKNIINLPYAAFLDCINYKTKINRFDIWFESKGYDNGMLEVV